MRPFARFLLVLSAVVMPATATAAPTFAARAGGVFEGPQHTLTNGFTAGGSVEWPKTYGALGIAVEWSGETGNNDLALGGYQSVFHAGAFGRWEIGGGGVRPFLEAGIGVSSIAADGGTGPLQFAESGAGLGGWVGVGTAMTVSKTLVARVDGRYSMITLESPNAVGGGGDMGDYFSVALSLAFVR